MAQARAVLADCTECAALAADLEVITRATAASAVPARPRDFRITPAQAANARGGIVDRVRRWLGSPGSVPVRPLAGAAVTMGLVLVLLAPSLQPTGITGDDQEAVTIPAATSVLKATPPAADPAGAELFLAQTDEPPSVEADMHQARVADSPSPVANGDTAARPPATDAPAPQVAEAPGDGDTAATPGGASEAAMDDTTFALTLLGIVLAGVGLMVLLLSWLARRWQDPLLR
jgi:hypothetical protein